MPQDFAPEPPVVIGIVGGIASGKSAVARIFAEAGLVRVDADRIARQVVAEKEVREQLQARFGAGIYDAEGRLDRTALGSLVFRDDEARAALDAITHPPIHRRIRDALDRARSDGRSALLDAPLLVENDLSALCDAVVFVDCPRKQREQRARDRGWPDGELQRREAAQADLAVKKSASLATIDNSGPLAATAKQVRAFLDRWSGGGLESAPP